MEKFVEFQPNTVCLDHLLLLSFFCFFFVIFACAGMRRPQLDAVGFFQIYAALLNSLECGCFVGLILLHDENVDSDLLCGG